MSISQIKLKVATHVELMTILRWEPILWSEERGQHGIMVAITKMTPHLLCDSCIFNCMCSYATDIVVSRSSRYLGPTPLLWRASVVLRSFLVELLFIIIIIFGLAQLTTKSFRRHTSKCTIPHIYDSRDDED